MSSSDPPEHNDGEQLVNWARREGLEKKFDESNTEQREQLCRLIESAGPKGAEHSGLDIPNLIKEVKAGDDCTIAVYNNKGGVLKSTTAMEYGFMLSDNGFNVLLVDADSQCSLTEALVRVLEPEDDIELTPRVRYAPPGGDGEGRPLTEVFPDGRQRYSLVEGLKINETGIDALQIEEVQPLRLRERGPPQRDRHGSENTEVNANVQELAHAKNESLRTGNDNNYSVGSIDLIIGHHDTTSISSAITTAINNRGNPNAYDGIHMGGSLMWVIKKAMKKTGADIAFIDLNPDTSDFNRAMVMQSKFIIMPSWRDMHAAKCVVDLRNRIVGTLDTPPNGGLEAFATANHRAWAQHHRNMIECTAVRADLGTYPLGDSAGVPLRIAERYPKILGLVLNTKEPYVKRVNVVATKNIDIVTRRFETAARILSGDAHKHGPDQRSITVVARTPNLMLRTLNRAETQRYYPKLKMAASQEDVANGWNHILGPGISNRETLKDIAPLRHKPMSQRAADPAEDVDAFTSGFRASCAELESDLAALPAGGAGAPPDLRTRLDGLMARAMELEAKVAAATYFLPAYDIRALTTLASGLRAKIASTRDAALPRKKFAFRKKVARTSAAAVADEAAADVAASATSASESSASEPSAAPRPAPTLTEGQGSAGLRGRRVVVSDAQLANRDWTLLDLEDCDVFLLGRMPALRMHGLRNCRVYGGPVVGATFVDDLQNCTLMLASHQVRIHTAVDCAFHLRTRSRPIIEHSRGLGFAPLELSYPGSAPLMAAARLAADDDVAASAWRNVDDFGWLRATASPNWRILPDAERASPPSLGGEAPETGIAEEDEI